MASVSTHIPMRSPQTHFYTLPKARDIPADLMPSGKKESQEMRKKEQIIDKFFTIFRSWTVFQSQQAMEFVLKVDCENWQAIRKHPRIVGIVHAERNREALAGQGPPPKPMDLQEKRYRMKIVFERIEAALKEHLTVLDSVFRHVQTWSESYPQLDWKSVSAFIKHIDFVDERYSLSQLRLDYIETYSFERKVNRVL